MCMMPGAGVGVGVGVRVGNSCGRAGKGSNRGHLQMPTKGKTRMYFSHLPGGHEAQGKVSIASNLDIVTALLGRCDSLLVCNTMHCQQNQELSSFATHTCSSLHAELQYQLHMRHS